MFRLVPLFYRRQIKRLPKRVLLVYLYLGGLFEWLLLQDIYGFDDFPTTSRQLDILKYKPGQKLNISYIENG